MALKEFKDYPNTDTPLNAENLNHNFNELDKKKDIYSATEIITNKIFFNKPVYRKCFKFNSNESFSLGIENIDYVTKMNCLVYTNGWRNLPWIYSNGPSVLGSPEWCGGFYTNGNNIAFQVGSGIGAWTKGLLIIEYTKTTDS